MIKKHNLKLISAGCLIINSAFLLGSFTVGAVTAENQYFTQAARLVADISLITFSGSAAFMVWAFHPNSCRRCESRITLEELPIDGVPEANALILSPLRQVAPFLEITITPPPNVVKKSCDAIQKASPPPPHEKLSRKIF